MRLIPSDHLIGGEVEGLNLAQPVAAETFETFKDMFYQRSVLTIRNQVLGGADLVRLAKSFGEPDQHFMTHYAHPDHPNVLVLSNIIDNGKLQGFADAGRVWHSDGSYMQRPVAVTMLYAIEVPTHEDGHTLGETNFAAAWAAYNELPAATKKKIETLQAVHQVGGRRRGLGTGQKSDRKQEDEQPEAIHPLVRIHPQTGRKYLFVSKGECQQIVGMQDDEALELIEELSAAIQQARFRHVHRWQVGDLLIWDNQAVQHLATFNYEWPTHRRLMHRISVSEALPAG